MHGKRALHALLHVVVFSLVLYTTLTQKRSRLVVLVNSKQE